MGTLTHDPIHNRWNPQLPFLSGTFLLDECSSGWLESVDSGFQLRLDLSKKVSFPLLKCLDRHLVYAGCSGVLLHLSPRPPQSSPVINPFQYLLCLHSLCSVTVSPRRLPGGGSPLGSDRIAPDLRDFPLVCSTALALPIWFTGPFPIHSVSTLPGRHPYLSSASSHSPVTLLDCPHLLLGSSGFSPPHCYQASQALSLQSYTQICHPLPLSQSGSLPSRVRFMALPRNSQSQNRRISPGKIAAPPHIPSNFTSVRFAGYQDSLTYACSSSSPPPFSWFAVRYVHGFCLMLPSDTPSLGMPLPCWRCPSVR
jgi:hypothetical protein